MGQIDLRPVVPCRYPPFQDVDKTAILLGLDDAFHGLRATGGEPLDGSDHLVAPGPSLFIAAVVPWPPQGVLVGVGADPKAARVDARLGVAVVRGLLLDLLATGDRKGTDAAFRRYLEYLSAVGQLNGEV